MEAALALELSYSGQALGAPRSVDKQSDADIASAAERFEALLVRMMIDAAQPAPPDDASEQDSASLEGDETTTYRRMLAQRLAEQVAAQTDLGVASAVQALAASPAGG